MTVDNHSERMGTLEEQNRKLREDVDFWKGIAQLQDQKTGQLQKETINLNSQNMATISGICGDTQNENCKNKTYVFLKEQVQILIKEEEIVVEHRLREKIAAEAS